MVKKEKQYDFQYYCRCNCGLHRRQNYGYSSRSGYEYSGRYTWLLCGQFPVWAYRFSHNRLCQLYRIGYRCLHLYISCAKNKIIYTVKPCRQQCLHIFLHQRRNKRRNLFLLFIAVKTKCVIII